MGKKSMKKKQKKNEKKQKIGKFNKVINQSWVKKFNLKHTYTHKGFFRFNDEKKIILSIEFGYHSHYTHTHESFIQKKRNSKLTKINQIKLELW